VKPFDFKLAAVLGGLILSGADRTEADVLPCLTSIRQVREIPPEQAAKSYPVRLRGVVTFCDSKADLGLFLQDASTAIYVKLGEGTNFERGDQLEVEGTTGSGDFVPLVNSQNIRVTGHNMELPPADRVNYEQMATGNEDCQWVEVRGVVRSVVPSVQGHTRVDFLTGGQRFSALVTHWDLPDWDPLIAATVRVRGACRTRFNTKRQMRAPFLSVDNDRDLVVENVAPGPPPEIRLAQLFRFNSQGYYGQRVKVKGTVTAQKGMSLFIQDGGERLQVKTAQTNSLVPGDWVAVTGFPLVGQYSPLLEDAMVTCLGHGPAPEPTEVKMEQLVSEDYEGELVRVHGTLMNRVQRAQEEVLVLEADNLILNARLDAAKEGDLFRDLQKGSELELTGVCLSQVMENWNPSVITHPESFQLLLRSPGDVRVIQRPPFWTLSRLLWMLAIMSVVLLAGFAWVFILDRRVRRQTAIIQQKLQREAVLEERTRIAREFHDTLEQELVAIMIQLETVAAQFDAAPRVARQMLELARTMARRSLFEAKRSVWDLRSHLLENSNLVTAISEVTKLMASSSQAAISVETSGAPRKLAPQMENNLLRITQEALTNALKHSRASQIIVRLDYDPLRLVLRISDDGVGFDTNNRSVIYGGHFGLLDMSERAVKMGGHFSMVSAPGQGTEIRVEVSDLKDVSEAAGAPQPWQEQMPA
jgi:signal transduction histidine kinase